MSEENVRLDSKLAFALVILSIAVLLPRYLPCNPYGDEAWYFYISKTLPWNWDPHLPFLPPIRWSFMLMFHIFAINIWIFRFAYIMINLTLFAIALSLTCNGNPTLLLLSALPLLNPVTLFFSTRVFTSVTAGSLAALSAALALRGRRLEATLVGIVAVGS